MDQLIKVTVKDDQQLVSARDLHKSLKLKKRFSAWVTQNFKEFDEGKDFTSVPGSTVVGNGATKPLKDYALTIDMAKELCMMSHTNQGKIMRRYFIEVEKKWNDPQEVLKRASLVAPHMTSDEIAMRNRELEFKKQWLKQMENQNANKRAELLLKLADHARGTMYQELMNEASNQLMFPIAQDKVFTAGDIAYQMGTTPYQIGIWGQRLGLKAPHGERNRYGYWKDGRYYYNQMAFQEMIDHQDEILDD